MRPKLKPPRTERLKLKCDTLISTFAFKFNLRRYIQAALDLLLGCLVAALLLRHRGAMVGRCRLTLSNPR
jgi:hypothetical protein